MRRILPPGWALFAFLFLCGTAPVFGADAPSGTPNPLDLKYDTAVWGVVVFVGLMLILRAKAWGPILEGLKKREETIRHSLEDAKKTREDMDKLRADFQRDLAAAHQEIPRLMEEARRKADAAIAERDARESAKLAEDRDRLRREMEIAKDQALKELWEQAAVLATLISAKVIGRALTQDDHHRLIDEALQEMRQTRNN